MGMSTSVVGYRPAEEKFKKMKAAWDACEAAGIDVPKEVREYFGDEDPRDAPGQVIDITAAKRDWSDPDACAQGYEIDITKLPEGVRYIRVYNAW